MQWEGASVGVGLQHAAVEAVLSGEGASATAIFLVGFSTSVYLWWCYRFLYE